MRDALQKQKQKVKNCGKQNQDPFLPLTVGLS